MFDNQKRVPQNVCYHQKYKSQKGGVFGANAIFTKCWMYYFTKKTASKFVTIKKL